MAVTNPDKVVTKQDLADFYDQIKPYLGSYPVAIANKFSKSDIYSTSEKMIGQWHDGKPIYQKTIQTTMPSAVNTAKEVAIGASIDSVISIRAILKLGSTEQELPNFTNSLTSDVGKVAVYPNRRGDTAKNTIVLITNVSTWLNESVVVTVQYTKSTDSATSIGVDTDYSTTEKIVGTWIDGSPLYQRTVTLTMPTVVTDGTKVLVNTDLSSWNISKCFNIDGVFLKDDTTNSMPINTIIYGSDNTSMYGVRCYLASASLLTLESSYSKCNGRTAYVTLQYTKTS